MSVKTVTIEISQEREGYRVYVDGKEVKRSKAGVLKDQKSAEAEALYAQNTLRHHDIVATIKWKVPKRSGLPVKTGIHIPGKGRLP